MKTLADILRERNARLTAYGATDCWIICDEKGRWSIMSHKMRDRHVVVEFETDDESKAVEQFLALTAKD